MDFKFKEVVEESIIYFYDHVLSSNEYTEDVFEELEHVYAQAAKADENEAKAKAFEKVAGIAYWYFERVNPEYADFSDYEGFYDDIKDEFKRLESGGSDD